MSNQNMSNQNYGCKNILKDKTCFKNPTNPTCIDLIITNRPKSIQDSEAIETGLSDFHKMSFTVMKVFYNKQNPKIIQYRKYKGFSNETFMHELESVLAGFPQISFGTFKSTVGNILQKHDAKTDGDRIAYNKQRNYCVSLIRK